MSYSLLDPDGAVVHVGSNSSEPFAFVWNDHASFGDAVILFAYVNDVSGLVTPPAPYQPSPDLYAQQSRLRFIGDVTAGSDFIPSLALPTEAAAYLGFSTKTFTAAMTFNDGDVFGVEGGPYQYVESYRQLRHHERDCHGGSRAVNPGHAPRGNADDLHCGAWRSRNLIRFLRRASNSTVFEPAGRVWFLGRIRSIRRPVRHFNRASHVKYQFSAARGGRK